MFVFDGQTSVDLWRLNRSEITHDVAQHEGNWLVHDHGNRVVHIHGNSLVHYAGNSTTRQA